MEQQIELKSPAVQEVLGRPPQWIIRWGITVILIVIAGLFVGSYFFKYPDVVSATVEVTTENLPVQLVARATGKIDSLFVADNEIVEEGQYLAVIENPAKFEDVVRLKRVTSYELQVTRGGEGRKGEGRKQKAESGEAEGRKQKAESGEAEAPSAFTLLPSANEAPSAFTLLLSANEVPSAFTLLPSANEVPSAFTLLLSAKDASLRLGELQPHYYQLIKSIEDYNYFIQADYYNQKINALRRQIALQQQLKQRTRKQSELSREQLVIQERLFASDSILYVQRAIALIEYESARNALLQMQQAYQSALSSIDNIQLTITQYEQNIFDLQQQAEEKRKELLLSLSGAYEALKTQINQWELQYTFKSARSGKVSMTKQWQKNQHITAGEAFLNIVPEETAQITGKILLPAQGAGKVKTGQTVNVKFDGYPHMEFGMVKGKVKNISLVPIATPQGKFTMVEVEFPDNLITNYGKTLDFSQEMSGTADIITEDMRLIERFFNPIRSLMKR